MFVVKHNKQFNSDSQRLAFSLRVGLSVCGAVFKFSVCAAHTLIGRYSAGDKMDLDKLFEFCCEVRECIEQTPKSEFPWNSPLGISDFPSGCCGETSRVLATLLYDKFGIVCDYILASDDVLCSHGWLEFDGHTIDITGDQYNSRGNYGLNKVIVEKQSQFHKLFESTKNLGDARHSSLNDPGSMPFVYSVLRNKIAL